MKVVLEKIADAKTPAKLKLVLTQFLGRSGIDQFEYEQIRNGRTVSCRWQSTPRAFSQWKRKTYGDELSDISLLALGQHGPFCWTTADVPARLKSEVHKFAATAATLGVHNIVTIPIHMAGTASVLLHLSNSRRNAAIPDTPKLWGCTAIGYLIAERMCQLELAKARVSARSKKLPALTPALTEREISVLRLSMNGKSYDEIAVSMGLRRKTVDHHAQMALHKLGVDHRIAAILQSIRLGILDL